MLVCVRDAFEDVPRTWHTTPSRKAEALRAEGEDVRLLAPWDKRNFGPGRILSGAVVASRLRPSVVITTGAGVAVPFCLTARSLGARTVFIETMARVESASTSGRLLSRLAEDVIVQWPELTSVYPGSVLCRPALLTGMRPLPAEAGRGTFVAVGTHAAPFDRLMRTVERAVAAGVLPKPVLVQSGASTYRPLDVTWRPWLAPRGDGGSRS